MSVGNIKAANGMNNLQQVDPRLRKAAEGMEANFIKLLVRNMRKSVPEGESTKNNRALQLFRGMLDDRYAESAARQGGIGLADVIVRQLTGNQIPTSPNKFNAYKNSELIKNEKK